MFLENWHGTHDKSLHADRSVEEWRSCLLTAYMPRACILRSKKEGGGGGVYQGSNEYTLVN